MDSQSEFALYPLQEHQPTSACVVLRVDRSAQGKPDIPLPFFPHYLPFPPSRILLFDFNFRSFGTIIICGELNNNNWINEWMKKRSERRKHCARAGCSKVRALPARLPATNTQTGPITIDCAAIASTECNEWMNEWITTATDWAQVNTTKSEGSSAICVDPAPEKVGVNWPPGPRGSAAPVCYHDNSKLRASILTKRVCVKCSSVGSNTCKMWETVRVISRILHMVNSDPLTTIGVLGVTVWQVDYIDCDCAGRLELSLMWTLTHSAFIRVTRLILMNNESVQSILSTYTALRTYLQALNSRTVVRLFTILRESLNIWLYYAGMWWCGSTW